MLARIDFYISTHIYTIQYNTKFVKRHVAVASEALISDIVFKLFGTFLNDNAR